MTEYLVIRRNGYRGHPAGTTFEAALEQRAEQRALARGDIAVVTPSTPSLQPGSYTLPDGWPNRRKKEEVQ